jgi:hydrogenase maturation protease
MRTLVLGLGNPILTDDGVGIHVVRAAAALGSASIVEFEEASVGGLRLLEIISGYDQVILVDALQTAGGKPGDVLRLSYADLPRLRHSGCSHDLSLTGALALGHSLGLRLPTAESIRIVGVQVEDVLTFGESCTPSVAAAIPAAVRTVLDELERLLLGRVTF